MKQSSSPHSTSRENCWITFMMMGPRQIAGESRSTMKPSDISFTPWASSGWILPPRTSGFRSTPIMRGMLGP